MSLTTYEARIYPVTDRALAWAKMYLREDIADRMEAVPGLFDRLLPQMTLSVFDAFQRDSLDGVIDAVVNILARVPDAECIDRGFDRAETWFLEKERRISDYQVQSFLVRNFFYLYDTCFTDRVRDEDRARVVTEKLVLLGLFCLTAKYVHENDAPLPSTTTMVTTS